MLHRATSYSVRKLSPCRKWTAPATSSKLQDQLRFGFLRWRQNVECRSVRPWPQEGRETVGTGAADCIWWPPTLHESQNQLRTSAKMPTKQQRLDRPVLAVKETEPAPRIFPIRELFFFASAGNKMTVSWVYSCSPYSLPRCASHGRRG